MLDNEYSCTECTNSGTPICKDCRYIAYAGGTQSRPTLFCSLEARKTIETYSRQVDEMAELIASAVQDKKPIPVLMLIRYNHLVSKK